MSKLNQWVRGCCFAFVLVGATTIAFGQNEQPDESIQVMSFNIRLGVAKDGDNHWNHRKEMVVAAIENARADLIGTQETWDFQAEYLAEKLPGFRYVGRSRQNDDEGEQCGILYRASRFDKLIEGHFWLSETPDRPGSKSWDSSLPRMATWLKLWDRLNERSVYVINTHFDHRGIRAREESAKQIRSFVESLPADSAVIVTGDFNASVGSAPYRALFGDDTIKGEVEMSESQGDVSQEVQDSVERRLIDTYRGMHREDSKQEGTFNGFAGKLDGARIDWIAATENLEVATAEIDRYSVDGRYPSDHFPVTAKLKFKRTP